MTELEEECIRRIAAEKMIPAKSITLDSTLESLAIDSLDRVTLAFDLEEKYGVEIPEAKLHQITTVRDVAVAVEQALTKKQMTARGVHTA
ncbi:acyl carrier protein [Terriglobus roseus DSM 18391]|uniref:Acyl carrier protein n=1 Tax=Terriglobus roseus (strain DSM 18391 / NRRL B-41598 / KBS 63) TaxID=926566 RepID=I3ZMJ0_TERRK|nr:acyl carrier protein [Terriglobus roseus]AFL90458.1 acyl carrier protein [Terriglobus roseus DSM 18391]